ncbi:MAG: prolyl oligopeptidase family serine peptidase [Planctomycetaceae bacterium]|nr:prolyl oligopeptidase family serine peptidase [Planctomycetaceae bacterium]
MKFSLTAALAFSIFMLAPMGAPTLYAQVDMEEKRPLDHEDYAKWNSLGGQNFSPDGNWVSYTLSPAEGDATLKIRQVDSAKEFSVLRGQRPRFTDDNQYVLYVVAPSEEEVKRLKKAKVADGQIPKSKLEILNLKTGKSVSIRDVANFSLPAKAGGWVAFKTIEPAAKETAQESKSNLSVTYEITPEGVKRSGKAAKKPKKNSKQEAAGKKKPAKTKSPAEKTAKKTKPNQKKKTKKNGTTLVLRNLDSQWEQRIPFVTNFRFSEDGKQLAYATSSDAEKDGAGDGVHLMDLAKLTTRPISSGVGNYGQVVFSKDGKQIAFLSDKDDYSAEQPNWALYRWSKGAKQAKKIVATDTKGFPKDWIVAEKSAPLFAENGKRIYFNTRPKPVAEKKKAEGEQEKKAKLDIWHWQDPYLQPQQLLQAQREKDRSYRAVYDVSKRKMMQLATKDIPLVVSDPRSESSWALGVAPDQYNKMRSWDIQSFSDWYLIDLKTGEPRLARKMVRGSASLSPQGKYLIWWDGEKRTWLASPTAKPKKDEPAEAEPVDIGKAIGQPLFNELHDTPSLPEPYGIAGWLDDDKHVLIYDRWDIWQVDPSGETAPVCLTGGQGRDQQVRFRVVRLDREARTIDLQKPQVLSAFVHADKSSGYYQMDPVENAAAELKPLIVLDENVSGLRKARDADEVMFTRQTFDRYPDLWVSDMNFKKLKRISRANPQQDNYVWGTSELVKWNAKDGQELEGLLYKPENFDPQKKYPLMVYFYERNSDNLHRYYTPAAGRSIINFSFYVSRGYVIFVPDIPYKVGEPGPSAANAILPGVEHVVSKGFIDEKRIGMQGHSWGGYQTAYLVTMTDMFCCAESGAPVSNMTSAYGGIRWGTGMSRMFQYEKTQSRIGETLWEARDKYIANSPLFFADKVNTPLLILHNDQDTAVPWYQGIELFVAMRRLEKPCWMLNYNGEPHWVMSDENRMDFAKRMQQFFDHYMLGDPMPIWMAEGIPAVDKGEKFGFEYVEEPEEKPAADPAKEGQAEASEEK